MHIINFYAYNKFLNLFIYIMGNNYVDDNLYLPVAFKILYFNIYYLVFYGIYK